MQERHIFDHVGRFKFQRNAAAEQEDVVLKTGEAES